MYIINWVIIDVVTIAIMINFFKFLYLKRYGKVACDYIKGELDIFMIYCLTLTVGLYAYYYLEQIFLLDEKYTNGIILTFFYGGIGLISKWLCQKWINQKSKYKPTKEEYLFIIEIAFIIVSIKMISERIIGWVIPIAILFGRMIWIDTMSIKEVIESIKVGHDRIIETSILLLGGIVLISYLMWYFNWQRYVQIVLAILYGVVILLPVERIRKLHRDRRR